MGLRKLAKMGTWFMWPRIWPHGGLCKRRNKRLVSKKYVVLLGYLIECERLKLVGWCMVILLAAITLPTLFYLFLVVGLETTFYPVNLK
jgi:hypothetical protein